MKKVLIIGASILQLPAIRKAKELGYHVGVADDNPNAVGISDAAHYAEVCEEISDWWAENIIPLLN